MHLRRIIPLVLSRQVGYALRACAQRISYSTPQPTWRQYDRTMEHGHEQWKSETEDASTAIWLRQIGGW